MKTTLTTLLGLYAALTLATPALADNPLLQSMERSRANLVNVMLDPNLAPEARAAKLSYLSRSHLDLERMVVRDDALLSGDDPHVKATFASYDRSFLVHASREKNLGLTAHWLHQVGLDAHSVKNGEAGWR